VFGVCVARLAHENSDRRRTLNSGTDVRGGKGILSKRTLKVLTLKFKGKLLLWANYCRKLDASFMNEFGNVRGVGRAPVMRVAGLTWKKFCEGWWNKNRYCKHASVGGDREVEDWPAA